MAITCRIISAIIVWTVLFTAFGCSTSGPKTPANSDPSLPDGWQVMVEPAFLNRAIWVNTADDVWAVNGGGQILHYDGTDWQVVHETGKGGLTGLWGFSATDVFASGAGGVLHFNGTSWLPMKSPLSFVPLELWGTADGILFGAGRNGAMARWEGQSWEMLAMDTSETIISLWGTGPDHVLALDRGGVLHRFDGQVWSVVPGSPFSHPRDVWASAPDNIVLIAGENGPVRFDGDHWQAFPEMKYARSSVVWGTGPDDFYLVGEDFAHFDGQNWTIQERQEKFSLWAVHGDGNGSVFAAGSLNEIWENQPDRWQNQVPAGMTQWFTDVWGASENAIFFTSGDREVYRWNGLELQKEDLPVFPAQPITVWGSSENDVHVAGSGQEILHYNGVQWSSRNLGENFVIKDMWGSSATDIYAVGMAMSQKGQILHFDGNSWTVLKETWDHELLAVGGRGPNDVTVSLKSGGLLHFDGESWEESSPPGAVDYHSIWIGKNHGFAVGESGKILALVNDAWIVQESGVTENLLGVWGTDEGKAVAVGYDGRILHYDGQTWSVISSSANQILHSVWGVPGGDVIAVGKNGIVMRGTFK